MKRVVVVLCAVVLVCAGLSCKSSHKEKHMDTAKTSEAGVTPYPLDTCIVSGEKLDAMGEPVVKVYAGREVRFCCPGCVKKFEADKAGYLAKIDAKARAGH